MDLKDSYELHPDFECIIAWATSSKPQFYSQVGYALDADCFEQPSCKLLVQSSHVVAKSIGHGPDNAALVLEHLQRRVSDGNLKREDLIAAADILDDVEDSEPPALESIMAALVPVIQRRLQSAAVMAAQAEYAKHGDFSLVIGMIDRAQRLGRAQASATGTELGSDAFAEIAKVGSSARLPTGIFELDLAFNSGVAARQLCAWVGSSGAGKSMALVHVAGEALRQRKFVGYVTLELPPAVQMARLMANLTGINTNDILEVPRQHAEAARRYAQIKTQIGCGVVGDMAPHATTVRDLVAWVEEKEKQQRAKMDLLVIDYADKLTDPRADTKNEYQVMRYVYEGLLHQIAHERNMLVWTASQANRKTKESGKRLDLHHIADSMHKGRSADVVITLNDDDQSDQITLFVAKNRLGPRSRFSVGPLPKDFDRARLTPLAKELGVW
jgi:replicative DNA helicase